jgi:hypothetical protein
MQKCEEGHDNGLDWGEEVPGGRCALPGIGVVRLVKGPRRNVVAVAVAVAVIAFWLYSFIAKRL